MSFDFSTAAVNHVLRILREIYFQSRILHPAEPSVKATGLYALPKQGNKSGQGGGVGARDPENWIQPRKKAEEIPRMVAEQNPRTIATQVYSVDQMGAQRGGLQESLRIT